MKSVIHSIEKIGIILLSGLVFVLYYILTGERQKSDIERRKNKIREIEDESNEEIYSKDIYNLVSEHNSEIKKSRDNNN